MCLLDMRKLRLSRRLITSMLHLSSHVKLLFLCLLINNVCGCIAPCLILRSCARRSGNKPAINSCIRSCLYDPHHHFWLAQGTTVYNDVVCYSIQDGTLGRAGGEGLFQPPKPLPPPCVWGWFCTQKIFTDKQFLCKPCKKYSENCILWIVFLTVPYYQNELQFYLLSASSDDWLNCHHARHHQHYHLHKQTNINCSNNQQCKNPTKSICSCSKSLLLHKLQVTRRSSEVLKSFLYFALSFGRYLNLLITCHADV